MFIFEKKILIRDTAELMEIVREHVSVVGFSEMISCSLLTCCCKITCRDLQVPPVELFLNE